MNSVKLYSNGSAVITRGYSLNEKPLKVLIPVKKEDLDDVVSSIAVFGKVTLPSPPSYTPTNSNPATLTIDCNNVMRDMATKLRGAEVKMTSTNGATTYTGKIHGIQTFQKETDNSVVELYRVILGTAEGIRQIDMDFIGAMEFTDPFVKSEIDKSLQASFSAIKPDSRNVELTLVPVEGEKEAHVAYATPCAAWKTRYQLRFLNNNAALEGQAVVDNDTDDDWTNVNLSVITGEPISFSTDIAEIRRPARSRVNVVSDRAAGAVNAQETYGGAQGPQGAAGAMGGGGRSYAKRLSGGLPSNDATSLMQMASGSANLDCYYSTQYNAETGEEYSLESAGYSPAPAPQQKADVKESGDFSVYTSPNPVTILSRKSAIINLFSTALEGAKSVLLYKPKENERRPFSAIKFTNNTTYSLNKGVCEVYVDGDRQGKCVLENTKKGEDAILVHAIETGVKVFRSDGNVESRRIGIKLAGGVAYCEQLSTRETTYTVQNSKAEAFQFMIEYDRTMHGSKVETNCQNKTVVETPKGVRVSTELPANGTLVVTVKETLVQEQQYAFGSHWLQQQIIATKNPIARQGEIGKVVELQQKVDEIQREMTEIETQSRTLKEEQTRLSTLIPSVHPEQANLFRNEIAEAEKTLKEYKAKLPELRKSKQKAEDDLQKLITGLKAEWTDENAPQPAEEAGK